MIFDMPDMRRHYISLVNHVVNLGQPVTVRGMDTRELLNVQLHVDPNGYMLPLAVGRKVNTTFAAVEALQVISGECYPELLAKASPHYAKVLVDSSNKAVHYAAYGPRIIEQLGLVAELLLKNPTTRQAVIHIHRPDDLLAGKHTDVPCTLTLQFYIRGEWLHMTTNMRSNDVWLGTAYDVFVFTQLMWTMLHELNRWRQFNGQPLLKIGQYTHIACSLHIYERDVPAAMSMVSVALDEELEKLPTGLRSVDDEVSAADNAFELLNGRASKDVADAFPWYTNRLLRIGVEQNGN